MAFGDGGVDGEGHPITPSGAATALNHELLRKTVDGHTFPSATTCRYACTLEKTDLVGQDINEITLIDANNGLVMIKTFTSKPKDGDMVLIFEVDDEF